MFLVKLALRNLTRHKRRTLVTASVIALGLFMYIFIDSMMLGMEEMSFTNIIDLESGHLQIAQQAYWEEDDELPLDSLVTYDRQLIQKIEGVSHYVAQTPVVKFSANLNNGIDELPIIAYGIDPVREKEVFTTDEYFIEGSPLQSGQYQAVLGKNLAQLMDLELGDYLTLVVKTKNDAFNTIDAEITGLLHSPNPNVNDNAVYVPLDIAQKALNIGDQVSEVIIRLDDKKYTEEGESYLSSQISESLEVKTWKHAAKSMIAMSKAQDMENQILISVILIMAAIGIINTIILAALERLEETGMMKAMGMKEWEIIFAYMVESVGIGVLGGVIGWILGAIGVILLTVYGVDMAWFGVSAGDYGIPIIGTIYGAWNFSTFIFVFFFGGIVALLASILPARWAARKDPIDAIYKR